MKLGGHDCTTELRQSLPRWQPGHPPHQAIRCTVSRVSRRVPSASRRRLCGTPGKQAWEPVGYAAHQTPQGLAGAVPKQTLDLPVAFLGLRYDEHCLATLTYRPHRSVTALAVPRPGAHRRSQQVDESLDVGPGLGGDTPRKRIEANRGMLAFNLSGGDLQDFVADAVRQVKVIEQQPQGRGRSEMPEVWCVIGVSRSTPASSSAFWSSSSGMPCARRESWR